MTKDVTRGSVDRSFTAVYSLKMPSDRVPVRFGVLVPGDGVSGREMNASEWRSLDGVIAFRARPFPSVVKMCEVQLTH